MKKEKKGLEFVDTLKSTIKSKNYYGVNTNVKQYPKTSKRPNHQPSWMYRNE